MANPFSTTYRQVGMSSDQLKKLRSVQPIHQQQDSQVSTVSKEEKAAEDSWRANGGTRETAFAQAAAERLGLNEADTATLHDYAKHHEGFNLQDLHLLAGTLLHDTTPERSKSAGVETLEELLKREKERQDLGISKPISQIIDEAVKEVAKASEEDREREKEGAIDEVFAREFNKGRHREHEPGTTVAQALQDVGDEEQFGKKTEDLILANAPELDLSDWKETGSDGEPLDNLGNTEPPQKPSASEGAVSLGDGIKVHTAQDGDLYANGMGNDWDSGPGQNGSGKGENGSGSTKSTNNSSNGSTSGSDDGGNGSNEGSGHNSSGDGSTPVTGGENDSKPKSDSPTGTGNDGSGDQTSGGNESGSGSSATTTTILGKSENGNTTKYTWMRTNNDTERAVFGETTYTQQEDGTYREEVSWFGADSGKAVNNVTRKFEGNSGDSTNSDDDDHAYFGVNITGNCDGMNPWKKKARKAPTRIVRNPGNIDPINPNYADAVFSADGAAEKWAREGLGNKYIWVKTDPGTKPADNPTSEEDGHTCPTSGDADRDE
ncbi:hypothetical protein OAJ60_00910 [Planctomycetaceae bacterium]|nr:hypothetical protein [Planctomycetaceae bacterium]